MNDERRLRRNARLRERYNSDPEYREKKKASNKENREKDPEYQKKYYEDNKERLREQQRQYYQDNKERIVEQRKARAIDNPEKIKDQKKRHYAKYRDKIIARSKAYDLKHRERVLKRKRLQSIRKRYGITQQDFDQMIKEQNGRCKCCNTVFGLLKGHNPSVDHCHTTGEVRGILCTQCNCLLGHANDNPEILRQCASYLESQGISKGVADPVSKDRKKKGVKDDSSNDIQHVLFSEGPDTSEQPIVDGTGEGTGTVDGEVSSETAA